MAIANSDGSIILSTKVDTSGVKKATNELRSEAMKLAAQYRKAGMTQSEAQKRAYKELGITTQATKKATKATKEYGEQAQKSFGGLKSTLQSLAGYLALAFSVTKIIQFSNESASLATQTEASVQRLVDIYGSASDAVGNFIDANARALGMSKAAAASFSSVYGNLFSVWADQATNAELTNRYLNMTAVVASKTGRTVEDVQERVRSGLLGNTEAIEDLGVFVNVKTIEMTEAFQRMADGKSWEQLDAYTQQQIRSMAILEQATAKYGNEVANTSATIRNQFNAAYQDFQNSWGTIVNQVLLPVLQVLTEIFNIAIAGLNALSGISGKILENAHNIENNSNKTADNIEEQEKNQKKLNKELKKGLASFDEINTLAESTAEAQGYLGNGTTNNYGVINNTSSNVANEIDSFIAEIMGYVGFGLAALGIILVCFGHIGWGIGFIIAGATILHVSQAALKEGEAEGAFNRLHDTIMGVSSLFLILGIILVCCGVVTPLSIGLIVAGASGWVYEATVNWNYLKTKIEQVAKENKALMFLGSALLLVIGVALLFTGIGIPFGLAWISAGAQGISTGVTEDWDFLPNKFKEIWSKIKKWWDSEVAHIFTLKWWKDLSTKCGNGLIEGFEGAVNGIITLFEKMINIVVKGLNKIKIELPDWDILGDLAGKKYGINISKAELNRISIPRLAQGAVIPPNREFMAILGDQKHGTNIEAPLDTIKQAVAEVLAQVNVGGNGYNGRIEVPVIIDGREIARAVREAEGNMGTQTVFGGFANVY